MLTERDMENSATLHQQKRKLARLKDAVSKLMSIYTTTDARDRHLNQELTEEYRRITKQYKDLQTKFRHFEIADNQKYQDVWNMHADEAQEMAEKVLKVDKVIHTQLLGWKWCPPELSVDQLPKTVTDTVATLATTSDVPTISGTKLKMLLEILSNEAGFLINPKVKAALKTLEGTEEAQVLTAQALFQALNISNVHHVQLLLNHFFDENNNTNENEEWQHPDGLKISPDAVIAAITTFVKQLDHRPGTISSFKGISNTTTIVNTAIRRKQDGYYWKQVETVLPAKTKRVWSALESGLLQYNAILESRSEKVLGLSALNAQNNELKGLLRQYLGSEVNDNLLIPPSQTIRVQAPSTTS